MRLVFVSSHCRFSSFGCRSSDDSAAVQRTTTLPRRRQRAARRCNTHPNCLFPHAPAAPALNSRSAGILVYLHPPIPSSGARTTLTWTLPNNEQRKTPLFPQNSASFRGCGYYTQCLRSLEGRTKATRACPSSTPVPPTQLRIIHRTTNRGAWSRFGRPGGKAGRDRWPMGLY
jgi:hypothetical protein